MRRHDRATLGRLVLRAEAIERAGLAVPRSPTRAAPGRPGRTGTGTASPSATPRSGSTPAVPGLGTPPVRPPRSPRGRGDRPTPAGPGTSRHRRAGQRAPRTDPLGRPRPLRLASPGGRPRPGSCSDLRPAAAAPPPARRGDGRPDAARRTGPVGRRRPHRQSPRRHRPTIVAPAAPQAAHRRRASRRPDGATRPGRAHRWPAVTIREADPTPGAIAPRACPGRRRTTAGSDGDRTGSTVPMRSHAAPRRQRAPSPRVVMTCLLESRCSPRRDLDEDPAAAR